MNTKMNERDLRELAYNIWEAEGRPIGQADRHWYMAVNLAESDGEQYMSGQTLAGETFAGENFLGDDLNSDDQSTMLADGQEYTGMNARESHSPADGNGRQQSMATGRQAAQSADATSDFKENSKDKNKKKSGKSKSSGNILV